MPSSPSGTRGNRWKRRKRDPQNQSANRRLKNDDDDEEDDDEDDLIDREDDAAAEDATPNAPDRNRRETDILAVGGVRISDFPPVVKRTVNRLHSSVLAIVAAERASSSGESRAMSGAVLENVSYGQIQAISAVPADSPSLTDGEGLSSFVMTPPRLMEGRGVVRRYGGGVLVVPMPSDWFSPLTVHRLEKVVPHYFSGKSADHTPEKYMECRNCIVAKYMENPDKRLTISDCKGLVVGVSEDDLAQIVRFLDHWGIINYCAASSPPREPWDDGSHLKEDQNGEVHVPSTALKSIDSLIKFDKPICRLKIAHVYSSSALKDDGVSDLDNEIQERLSENCCLHCSQPLLDVHYQSQKEVDLYLCVDCFHEGIFCRWPLFYRFYYS